MAYKPTLHNLTLEKWELIIQTASKLVIPSHNLATVIAYETAGSFSPTAVNPKSKAIGLIQFTKTGFKAIEGKGYSYDALSRMSFKEQLEGPVVHYLLHWGMVGTSDLASLYMAIFAPAARFKPNTYKLYSAPSKAYEQNKGNFDKENKGYITKGDAAKEVFQMFKKVATRVEKLKEIK